MFVLTPTCLFTLLAVAFWIVSPQYYSATALLMINNHNPYEAQIPAAYEAPLFIRGEMEVLRSSALLQSLITEENLESDPEFSVSTSQKYGWNWLQNFLGVRSLSQEREVTKHARLLEKVRRSVNISQLNRALVIGVSVQTRSAEKSAHIANKLIDLYLSHQKRTKIAALQTFSSAIKNKLHHMRRRVYDAETAVVAFRKSHNLEQKQNPSLNERHQRDLVQQIAKAKAHRASVEGTLQRLQLAKKSGRLREMPDATTSTNIRNLAKKQIDLQHHLSELETRYGPKHPRVKHTKAELTKVIVHLNTESLAVVQHFQHAVAMARYQETTLEEELRLLTHQRHLGDHTAVQLRELERRAETERKIYKNFLDQFQETTHQIDLEHPDIRILSKAFAPDRPSGFPRPALVAVGFFVGLFLGIVTAAIMDRLDRTLRDPEEVLPRVGIPMAGVIPLVKSQGPPTYEDNIEDLRNLTQSLLPLYKRRKAPIIAITSALPGEGKTTLVHHIGQVLARSGKQTLLIDADLRRPGLTPLIDRSLKAVPVRACTLTSVLDGSHPPEKTIIPLDVPGLSLLPGSLAGTRAPDLLGGPHIQTLLRYAQGVFDVIIFDTPPILPVADTCIIAKACHKILFAIHWNGTLDVSIRYALERLNGRCSQTTISAVLTMMDLRKKADYDYGRYVQRYSRIYDA